MILYRHRLKSATTEVTVCPLGDIQWAGDEEDIAYDHLGEHVETCLDQPHPLFVGTGDYIDFASPSTREALRSSVKYDTAKKVIADASKHLVDDLYTRLLRPTQGHWLGLVEGHHHHPVTLRILPDGSTLQEDSDVYLAKRLGAKFLEEFGIVKLEFGDSEHVVNFVVFHGSGSSVFPWGPLQRLYRLAPNFHVDFMLMGHQTKKAKADFDRMIFPDDGPDRLEHRPVKMIGCGGWMKGYVNGKATYVSRATLAPVALGQPIIHIRPRYRQKVWEPQITEES